MARYWVGGAGSWSQTSHWSTSSGGAGGASVPTIADPVIIDYSSGSPLIQVDQDINALSLSVAPYVYGGAPDTFGLQFSVARTITVAGNVQFGRGVSFYNPHLVKLVITATSTFEILQNRSTVAFNEIEVNAPAGTVTMSSGQGAPAGGEFPAIYKAYTFTHTAGTIIFANKQNIGGGGQSNPINSFGVFNSTNNNTRTIDFNASSITTEIKVQTGWNISGSNLTFSNATLSVITIVADGRMLDTFTDIPTTLLSAHQSDSGTSWTQHTAAGSGVSPVVTTAGRIRSAQTAGTESIWYTSLQDNLNDYSVQADVYCASNTGDDFGICGRMSTNKLYYYLLRLSYTNGNGLQLFKCVDGAFTLLGTTYTYPMNVGQTATIALTMVGTTISGSIDGNTVISVTDTTPLSGAVAGVRGVYPNTDSTGFHLDNFKVIPTTLANATFTGGTKTYGQLFLNKGKADIIDVNTFLVYGAGANTVTAFKNSTTITGLMNIGVGSSFIIQSGTTLNAKPSSFAINGTINSNVSFTSSTPGSPANFTFGASRVVSWWSLRDINYTGGQLVVYRGTDLGNNTNVVFRKGITKYFTYDVYSSTDVYRGQYIDVVSDPNVSQQINNPGGEMVITRAVDPTNFSEGFLVDFNNKVIVKYYSEDAINGAVYMQGFISSYIPNIEAGSQSVQITILPYGAEFSQYLTITDPTVDVNIGFNYDPAKVLTYTQTNKSALSFTTGASTTNITALNLYPFTYKNSDPTHGGTVTVALYKDNGSNTPDNTTPIYSSSFPVPPNMGYYQSIGSYYQISPGPTVTSSSKYWVVVSIDYGTTNIDIQNGSPYSGGNAAYWNGTSWVQNSNYGVVNFQTFASTGNTEVTYSGASIRDVILDVMSNYNLQGGKVIADISTIDATNTTMSYTFQTNTVKDAIQKCIDLSPPGWYWYVDMATNRLHVHKIAETPKHYFTLGKDTSKVQLQKTVETVINNVLVIGGDDGSGFNLFRNYSNGASQARYGRRTQVYNDSQLTTAAAADAVAKKIIGQFKDPTYRAPIEILSYPDNGYPIETIKPGDTFFVQGLTTSVMLQVSRVDYNAYKASIDASTIMPQINDQATQTEVGLLQQKSANNPAFPTQVSV